MVSCSYWKGEKMQKPCLTCTRVKDPANCESKQCKTWSDWFIKTWEQMRTRLGYGKESK